MKRHHYSKEEVEKAVAENKSYAGVLRQFGLRPSGANYRTIHDLIDKYSLDTSHFTGQGWNVSQVFKPQKEYSLEEILIENSPYRCNRRLKTRLIKVGFKERKCERCGLTQWQGNEIPLEIHHINGKNTDNRLANLQFLCPNCHALTEHYRGQAKKRR